MDVTEKQTNKENKIKPINHREDEFMSGRKISRKSSVGCSSRVSYYRGPEGVPFQWERQPGTPREPPKEEVLPPLSPPPAMLSLGLPKPCITLEDDTKGSSLLSSFRLKFWSLTKKRYSKNERVEVKDSDVNKRVESYSSDNEYMASPRNSSFSSLSSLSFSNDLTRESSKVEDDHDVKGSMRRPFGCSPVNFSSIFIRFAKRR